jgi:hypothetical protein
VNAITRLTCSSSHLAFHSLEFAILLPSSISPSIECDSGKLRYTLHAEYLDSTGEKSHSKSKEVLIVSTGASAASSTANEEALVDMISYNHAVGVCRMSFLTLLLPSVDGTYTNRSVYNFVLSQQPFSARLISDQPTVGSLLYLHLHLPSPLVGVTLYQVSVTANQKISLDSDTYGKGQNTTERHLLRLFNLPNGRGFSDIPPLFTDVQDIRPWKAGDQVTLEYMVRLPSHEVGDHASFLILVGILTFCFACHRSSRQVRLAIFASVLHQIHCP